jgi:hypothetical protein
MLSTVTTTRVSSLCPESKEEERETQYMFGIKEKVTKKSFYENKLNRTLHQKMKFSRVL